MAKDNNSELSSGALLNRLQDMNSNWLDRMSEVRDMETTFGARLINAKSPSEAMTVCNEWMAKRMDMIAAEQREFGSAWVEMVSDAMKTATATAQKFTPTSKPSSK